jgi:hypothetical protein
MTTSGTVTFRTNRDQIIQSALRLCNAIDPENTAAITTSQITNAAEALNLMVKSWETTGLQLWERKYAAIFPQKGQEFYALGNPGPSGDHACLSTPLGTGFIDTTATNGVAASVTTLVVTATSNAGTVFATIGVPAITMASGDNIGIQQTDGTMFWTTINGALAGNTVTLTTGPTIGCSAGARVITYTTKLVKPLRLLDGFTRQSGGNDIPHLIISRELYNRFGMKSSQGTSIQLYYDVQENTGHLYVYPTTADVTQTLFIEFQKPIEDFNSASDDFDMPGEWGEALKYNLALRIAPEYSVPKEKYDMIKELASVTFGALDSWDQEAASVFIQPSQWSYMHDSGGSN